MIFFWAFVAILLLLPPFVSVSFGLEAPREDQGLVYDSTLPGKVRTEDRQSLDVDGHFEAPGTRIGSFKSFVSVAPGAGACPFQGYEFEHEVTGKKWDCPFEGTATNPVEQAATTDGIVSLQIDDQTATNASGPTTVSPRSRLRFHATDCTALTDGVDGQACWEKDSNRLFVCEPTAGGCDTAAEWIFAGTLAAIDDQRILGNVSGSNAVPIALTPAQVRGMADVTQVLLWALTPADSACSTTANYFTTSGTGDTTSADIVSPMPVAGVVRRIDIDMGNTMDAGITMTITLQLNEVDTATTCAVGPGVKAVSCTGLSLSVAAGDRFRAKQTCAGGTEATKYVFVNLAYELSP